MPMSMYTRETFVCDVELERRSWTLPAGLYNCMRLLLSRAADSHVFVPIRRMQYLAVIDAEATLFIDSLGGYVVQGGQGGRPVELAWYSYRPQRRQTLHEPVPCKVVYYHPRAVQTMHWLVAAFDDAVRQQLANRQDKRVGTGRVVPLTTVTSR
jgi:hypothetical protein